MVWEFLLKKILKTLYLRAIFKECATGGACNSCRIIRGGLLGVVPDKALEVEENGGLSGGEWLVFLDVAG